MKNSGSPSLQLNFLNILKQRQKLRKQLRHEQISNRSETLLNNRGVPHQTVQFIPKYPYGRSSSVQTNRVDHDESLPNLQLNVFPLKIFQDGSPGVDRKVKSPKPQFRKPGTSPKIRRNPESLNTMKHEGLYILNLPTSTDSKTCKVRSVRIRTGSEAKRIKCLQQSLVDFDVSIKGLKMLAF